jgi:hypothetical protein
MKDLEPIARGHAISFRCTSCLRNFLAFGEGSEKGALCPCSAPLSPHPLPRGLYELRSAIAEEVHSSGPKIAPMPKEPDVGYGASHGYDAAHGGPSGPGDAPADVPEKDA